ncbi:GGDEF domain-containing protein [Thermodesulfobacterium sp. TA1]|uniref:GGDEF domain-containing protein n=1 Tax=Thermodesulfobacterium sp. TA1 TaxID=2234087 RepID=UPI00123187DB|nr:GGDEF domain-containing protein [Thermodesulfobacterium sp. TA1]QER42844.1 GGDEF domain-containing protein [Thermodesulfobacterium sp. TA1]
MIVDVFLLDRRLKDIAVRVQPIYHQVFVREAFLLFMQDEKLNLIPVINQDKFVVGQLQRRRFLEHIVLGKYGYGIHLNGNKKVLEIMEPPGLILDAFNTIEEAGIKLQQRKPPDTYDDIIVVDNNRYFGVVSVSLLVEALAQKSLMLAKDANPLTGLPGNWAIKSVIEEKIEKGEAFEVIYIDINYFKPFNDRYGFAKGDEVIIVLGKVIKEAVSLWKNSFVGHIGGDDFIVVTSPEASLAIAERIKKGFEAFLPEFHGKDYLVGRYQSKDREGKERTFPLLSLTLSIVSSLNRNITSYAHLASIASEVKAKAKALSKEAGTSVIFKDRRKDKSEEEEFYARNKAVTH